MNCHFKRAGTARTLSEAVSVADHDSKSRDTSHLADDRRGIRNVVQEAERHDDVETAVMKWQLLAASVVQDGAERLGLRAELANRLHALDLEVGTLLPQKSNSSASPRTDVKNALRPYNIE